MKRQHSCTLVLYFLYRCSTNICTRRIYILYKTDFERFAHFKCSQHSSFLLWKQMGVEGEDPKNTALLSVLCYSADDSADIPDGMSCNEKRQPRRAARISLQERNIPYKKVWRCFIVFLFADCCVSRCWGWFYLFNLSGSRSSECDRVFFL